MLKSRPGQIFKSFPWKANLIKINDVEKGSTLHLFHCESNFDSGQFLLPINACWEDSDRAKKVWYFSKLHSIIVNRKILYSDKKRLYRATVRLIFKFNHMYALFAFTLYTDKLKSPHTLMMKHKTKVRPEMSVCIYFRMSGFFFIDVKPF